jgi:ABC-type uncharacterized transport system substrate-binding protein
MMMTTIKNGLRILLPLVCMLILHGCATVERPEVEAAPAPQASENPLVIEAPQEAKPRPAAVTVEQPVKKIVSRPEAAILLSGDASAYRDIAEQLNRLFDKPVKVFTLTGADLIDDGIIDEIEKSPRKQVIAVGLRAAKAARELSDKQIVFCQVFNYSDHDLISENMKGVGAMPSPRKLFKDWKQLSPQLNRVIVITGGGFNDYIAMARMAAKKSSIDLVHKVVDTDREFLYSLKHNARPTQGHWVLADNRVLSVKVLKEVMAFNSKEAIQTVVFRPELLTLGGLFYVIPSKLEISGKVIARLEASTPGSKLAGDDIVFLDDHEMGINPQVARQLGLEIPEKLKASVHDQ